MAEAKIVTKMLLDSKDYESKLDKAKKSTQSYQKTASAVVPAVKAFAASLGVTVTAAAAFGEALKTNEVMTDKFRGAMAGAKAGVDSFLLSLSTGSFDGFIDRMKKTAAAARELYDVMDDMQTLSLYNQGDMAKLSAEREQYMKIVRNAKAVDENGNRLFTEDQVREAETGLKDVEARIKDTTKALQKATEDAITKFIEGTAKATGASYAEAEDYLNRFSKRDEMKARLNELSKSEIKPTVNNRGVQIKWMDEAAEAEYRVLSRLMAYVTDDDKLKEFQQLKTKYYQLDQNISQMESQSLRAMTRANGALNGGQKSGKAIVFDIQFKAGGDTPKASLPEAVASEMAKLPEVINDPRFSVTVDMERAKKGLRDQAIATGMDLIKQEQIDTVNSYADALSGLGSVVGGLSGLVDGNSQSWLSWGASAISSIAAVLPKLSTLAAAFGAEASQATASAVAKSAEAASAAGPIASIAAALSVAGTLISVIASIPKFATGGVVPGTSFAGDNMLARVNSGEVVLNKEQQNILDRRLGGMSGTVRFVIDGRQLVGVLKNENGRSTLIG